MNDQLQYCSFRLGNAEFAIEAIAIQEVLHGCGWTPVPRAPAHVLGLMNLRGQIVPVIDLAGWMGLASQAGRSTQPAASRVHIVLAGASTPLSLVVDEVGDVVTIAAGELQPPPVNLAPGARATVRGVHLSAARLLTVLETRAVLEVERSEALDAG